MERQLVLKKILIAGALALGLVGCTDAERASMFAYGDEAIVTCVSGGEIFREYRSTGKVMQLDGDGIAFRDKATGRFVRAFADCVVEEQ